MNPEIRDALRKAVRIAQTHVWNQSDEQIIRWLGITDPAIIRDILHGDEHWQTRRERERAEAAARRKIRRDSINEAKAAYGDERDPAVAFAKFGVAFAQTEYGRKASPEAVEAAFKQSYPYPQAPLTNLQIWRKVQREARR